MAVPNGFALIAYRNDWTAVNPASYYVEKPHDCRIQHDIINIGEALVHEVKEAIAVFPSIESIRDFLRNEYEISEDHFEHMTTISQEKRCY